MRSCILGINSAYHEPSACLLIDGCIVAMVEEERFNRVRYGKRSRVDNSDDLPEASMAWCLAAGGIGWTDLTAIGYSLDPDARLAAQRHLADAGRMPAGGWGTEDGERTFHRHNLAVRDKLLARAPQAEFRFLPHHLCHAASAFHVSPFEEAAVLVVDGIGESASTWLGVGSGKDLKALDVASYPDSLGFVWEKFSEFLGFDAYAGPGKVMGYGCITDPIGEMTGRDHRSAMAEILHPVPGGLFRVDNDAFRFRTPDFSGLERRFGPRRTDVVDRYEDASVAAALQEATNDILVHLSRRLYDLVNAGRTRPITDLCLAGGVALNCVANYELAARAPFRRIWVQPAANDAGTALGAAVLLHLEAGGSTRPVQEHAYLGPGYDPDAMKAELDAAGLAATRPDSIAAEVARRIERGQIVGWFQGRMEVGPRALGNRSIVCDPSRFDTRNRLNTRVKYRESFRPFAPSVLPEGVARFFETPAEMLATAYMLFALPVKDRRLAQVIPAVVQENGSTGKSTSRIHEVQPAHNPLYAQLISEFRGLTGLPLVLNTSFNIGEPILNTPKEAVATFLKSSMDAMAMGPYLVAHPGRK
jgi:carbamoyltransferase